MGCTIRANHHGHLAYRLRWNRIEVGSATVRGAVEEVIIIHDVIFKKDSTSGLAFLCWIRRGQFWIPYSLVAAESEYRRNNRVLEGTLIIPRWVGEKKGFF